MEARSDTTSDCAAGPFQQSHPTAENESSTAGQRPYVLVLCGVVGSGKSTFAQALETHLSERFARCNQDVLKTRQRVQAAARRALAAGKVAIIDRVNGDAQQRQTWVELAATFMPSPATPGQVQQDPQSDTTATQTTAPQIEVYALEFATPVETCRSRLTTRTGHETLHTPEKALDILERFSRHYTPPQPAEGFVKIAQARPSDFATAAPTLAEVQAVVDRLESAPRLEVSSAGSARQQYIRGGRGHRGSRPFRGRGNAPSSRGWHGNGRDNSSPRGTPASSDPYRQTQLPWSYKPAPGPWNSAASSGESNGPLNGLHASSHDAH